MAQEADQLKTPMDRVVEWDEARDPMRAPTRLRPWERLGLHDRELLDTVADGTWTTEAALKSRLGWPWHTFLLVTSRLVLTGWVVARPTGQSLLTGSEYRLSERAW